jgi:tripartite-type tricarboxylate transporter receptor subunit TctC
MNNRRKLVIALTVCVVFCGGALAQNFPAKPVRIMIGFIPGGGDDYHARTVAQGLGELLPQPVIVDYKPGAGGSIGWDYVAKSPADGYTLGLIGGSMTAAPSIYPKFPFDPVRDLAAVAQITEHQLMLVTHPSVPAKDVAQFIALARSRPGKMNYSSSGIGAMPHLAGALFARMAKIEVVHVPYRGGSASLLDVIAGQIDMTIATIPSAYPHAKSSKVRALGVTGRARARMAPEIPTIAEAALPGYEIVTWYGLFAPAGTPPEIVAQLNAAVVKVVAMPATQVRLYQVGSEPVSGPPEQLAQRVKDDLIKFAAIVRIAGARVD